MAGNSRELRKIQNNIYKLVNNFRDENGNSIFKDDDWRYAHQIVNAIRNVPNVNDINCGAGIYYNYNSTTDLPYRDYKLTVFTDFGTLGGYLRCSAAGSVDDPFKRYDVTVSVYPTKEEAFEGKRIIITRSQLREIGENQKTQVDFTGTNPSELGANAQEKMNDAQRAGLKQNSISLIGRTPTNNASDKDEVVVNVDTSKGNNIGTATTDAAKQAIGNGLDPNKMVLQTNVEDIANGTNESAIYTKKQIEEGRLAEMRRTGTMMSKKNLQESFLLR